MKNRSLQKILAIIPARAGSKRLPNKNLLDLGGKPLIAWTIESAIQSKYLNRIIVSTDSNEIADIALSYEKSEVPFIRPRELAQDNSSVNDVIVHLIESLQSQNQTYDAVVLLQPTSPFRTAQMIDEAIEQYFESKSENESVVSVIDTGYYYELLFKKNENGFLEGEYLNTNKSFTQEMKFALSPNGAIYIAGVKAFLENRSFYKGNIRPYLMSKESSIDIDTKEDFQRAEKLIKSNLN